MTMTSVKRYKTLQVLELMRSFSVLEQARKKNGLVPREGIRSWYNTIPVVLGLTTIGMMSAISYM